MRVSRGITVIIYVARADAKVSMKKTFFWCACFHFEVQDLENDLSYSVM